MGQEEVTVYEARKVPVDYGYQKCLKNLYAQLWDSSEENLLESGQHSK